MTHPAQDIVERLREAMDGVTPGKWERFPVDRIIYAQGGRYGVQSRNGPLVADCGEATNTYSRANAIYIALCSPDNIGALLDTISRLTADNEALRKQVSEARAAHHRASHKAVKRLRALWREKQAVEARADALAQEVERVRQERDDFQAVFDLRWEADMRAISKWRDAGPGRELTLPDHVDLVVFLFEWVEELLGALEPFARFAEKAERFVQGRADFGGSPIMPTKHFRLADFRRARAALANEEAGR